MNAPDPPQALPAVHRPRPQVDRRRMSEVLTDLAHQHHAPRISIGEVASVMRDRAHAALLFVFALVNFIPVPPGGGVILAIPVVLVALQLMLRTNRPWLPRWLRERSFAIEDFRHAVAKVSPTVRRIEVLLKPRLAFLATGLFEHVIGAVCLVLGIVMLLPLPVAGAWPPAFSICVLSLAILQRDGLAILIGLALSAGSVALVWTALFAAVKATLAFFGHIFE